LTRDSRLATRDSLFITFEGIEGSGKSLQARRLAARLRDRGLSVLETHEPGGTPLGTELRELLLSRTELGLTARAEALMMNASRAQLVESVIGPALERGEFVVCDRFADSTLAYQGAGRGLDMHTLGAVISFATAGLQPHMTMLLDVPVEVGLARKHVQEKWNRFEAETRAFHERVRDAYRAMAVAAPERWRCFDALQDPDRLADEIWSAVANTALTR
jgi:dTMP kinase